MRLQCFSDCTLIDSTGTRLIGPGEVISLPMHDAVKVMCLAHERFKILSPTPLLPGVAVCWSLEDRVQGPGIVMLVEGSAPARMLLVEHDGQLHRIAEQSVGDIDPWPAIDGKLEEQLQFILSEGLESEKVKEITEWVCTHFDEASLSGER